MRSPLHVAQKMGEELERSQILLRQVPREPGQVGKEYAPVLEHQMVRLRSNQPNGTLKSGTLGVVVMVHPSNPPAHEIRFIGEDGWMIALLTMREEVISAESMR